MNSQRKTTIGLKARADEVQVGDLTEEGIVTEVLKNYPWVIIQIGEQVITKRIGERIEVVRALSISEQERFERNAKLAERQNALFSRLIRTLK